METRYFMIINGQQTGPLRADELTAAGLTADTPVWREGLDNWVKASTLPELGQFLAGGVNVSDYPSFTEEIDVQQNPYGQPQQNPYGQPQQNPYGQPQQNPYGQPQQNPYGQPQQNPYGQPQQNPYGQPQQNPYGQPQQNPYGQPAYQPYGHPVPHTNWLPWAIIGIAVCFFCSCNVIGLVFGIIGAVNANKANNFYNYGDELRGDTNNSSAKTMTIISLVFAALGLISTVILISSGFFEALTRNYNY